MESYFSNYAGSGKPYSESWKDYCNDVDYMSEILEEYEIQPHTLLDLGCADGRFLQHAAQSFNLLPENCLGIEINKRQVKKSVFPFVYQGNINIFSDFSSIVRSRTFDIITANILMYIRNEDLTTFLMHVALASHENTIVFISSNAIEKPTYFSTDSSGFVDPIDKHANSCFDEEIIIRMVEQRSELRCISVDRKRGEIAFAYRKSRNVVSLLDDPYISFKNKGDFNISLSVGDYLSFEGEKCNLPVSNLIDLKFESKDFEELVTIAIIHSNKKERQLAWTILSINNETNSFAISENVILTLFNLWRKNHFGGPSCFYVILDDIILGAERYSQFHDLSFTKNNTNIFRCRYDYIS